MNFISFEGFSRKPESSVAIGHNTTRAFVFSIHRAHSTHINHLSSFDLGIFYLAFETMDERKRNEWEVESIGQITDTVMHTQVPSYLE